MLLRDSDARLPPLLFYGYIGVSVLLILLAGLMSGLTLALMSLDELDIEVLKRAGTQAERRHAMRIAPVIANEHFLLVTLLLWNALSTEALPIFLDKLVDPVSAVVLSVTVVLVIGEILPQAACKSYGLQVGSHSALLVRALMCLSAPISWPIGKLLDALLGEDQTALFRRAQLKALVGLHSSAEGLGGNLSADEISIITGALDLTSKTALEAMTPLDKVFMLPSDRPLDESALQDILTSGHSRLPVHQPGNRHTLEGLILVKELVLVDPDQGLTAGQLVSRALPRLPANTPLYKLLRLFESGGSHMVALTMPAGQQDGCCDDAAAAAQPGEPAGATTSLVWAAPSSASAAPPAAAAAAAAAAPAQPQQQQQQQQPASASQLTEEEQQQQQRQQQQQAPPAPASPDGGNGEASRPWHTLQAAPAHGGGNHWRGSDAARAGSSTGGGASSSGAAAGPGGAAAGAAAAGAAAAAAGSPHSPDSLSSARGDPVVGIITIEDVIEELLQQEIIDETDQYVDNLQVTRVDAHALTTSLPPRLRKAYAQQFTPRVGRLVVSHARGQSSNHSRFSSYRPLASPGGSRPATADASVVTAFWGPRHSAGDAGAAEPLLGAGGGGCGALGAAARRGGPRAAGGLQRLDDARAHSSGS